MPFSAPLMLDLLAAIEAGDTVEVDYTNYRGERGTRCIQPQGLSFSEAEWHPGRQWLLEAFDVGKNAERTFAVADIHSLSR